MIGYEIPITATSLSWPFTGELFRLGQAIFSLGAVAVPSTTPGPTPEPAATPELTLKPTSDLPTNTLAPTNTPTSASSGTETAILMPEPTRTQAPATMPTPGPWPGAIGTTVEAGGSSYTLNEVMDPAPADVFGVDADTRLVALDITQVGMSDDGDSYNALYFAVQDADGYVYASGFADADIEPRLGAGELAKGQIVRAWVTFEMPESAKLVSVLAQSEALGARITIADLAPE